MAGVAPWCQAVPFLRRPTAPASPRPLVVGTGPAGLFAALRLCQYGLSPLVVERGLPVDQRVRDVALYWRQGVLSPESNVQFGEGGAGTFSDGKLTYRGKDFRKDWVFETLVAAGAPEEILWEAKPHLGTDRLRKILRRLRAVLTAAGAELRFGTRVERLWIEQERVVGVETSDGPVRASAVFLAPGHSARDLYRNLQLQGGSLQPKGFALGVRVEVEQEWVERCQYGSWVGTAGLPRAEFTVKGAAAGRDVYSFCMCPGGLVIPAASEPEGLVVNGMSASGRSGRFANAALVVAVGPEDCGQGPLAGLALQRETEERAWRAAPGRAVPAQRVKDFLAGVPTASLPRSSCPWPLAAATFDSILPPAVGATLRGAFSQLLRQFPPLADGVLLGVETRTSSPVRLPRGEDLESLIWPGVYPVGEGAGYAGGIVSAAVDGARAADALAEKLGGGVAPDGQGEVGT